MAAMADCWEEMGAEARMESSPSPLGEKVPDRADEGLSTRQELPSLALKTLKAPFLVS
jgi:hypothetical protein